jgi:flagellar assembly protein FliH
MEAGGAEILRQARDAGFREGEAAGRAQAQAALHPVLESLARTIQELAALRPRLREQAEGDLIRLAVAIARRIVRRELTVDPEAIAGLVKAALEQLAAHEGVRVRVHPEHEAAVRACLAATAGAADIVVVGDAALARGSAVFDTARGSLDASAETQLAEIERGLTDRLRSPR